MMDAARLTIRVMMVMAIVTTIIIAWVHSFVEKIIVRGETEMTAACHLVILIY